MSATPVTNGKAVVIYSKASIFKILNGVTTSLDGGASLRMDVTDALGGPDYVGFTVLSSKNSTLQYSTSWELTGSGATAVWKTVPKAITPANGITVN